MKDYFLKCSDSNIQHQKNNYKCLILCVLFQGAPYTSATPVTTSTYTHTISHSVAHCTTYSVIHFPSFAKVASGDLRTSNWQRAL